MTDTSDNPRLEQFKAEIAAMRLKEPNPAQDAQRLRIGFVLMMVGIVVGVVAFFITHGTQDPLQQRDGIVIALIGVSVSITGLALYLRYGLTQFLRFWLARVIFEQRND
jgi:hypothetical protein